MTDVGTTSRAPGAAPARGGEVEDLRGAADRIEQLLAHLQSSVDARAWLDIEEVVRLLTDLYGAGLARMLAAAEPEAVTALAADELVGSLLLVHDLHPDNLVTRAQEVVASLASAARSAGGDVRIGIVDASSRSVQIVVAGGSPSLRALVNQAVPDALPDASVSVTVIPADVPVHLGPKPATGAATP